jgi:spermidine/putrescine transport system substrate-binding protein
VPYTWGTTGIGFNLRKFTESGALKDNKHPSLPWEIFWDKRFSQRMTLLDDGREVIGMALKMSGHSYNTTDAATIGGARDLLIAQKPLVMCYTSDQVIVELASGDSYLSQVFSGDAYQARRDNPDVSYVIPSNGASIWTDNFCIPTGAPHVDLAYKWINYMLEPAVAAACANFTNYAIANQSAWKLVDSHLREDPNLYPPQAVLDRCDELGEIGSAIFIFDRMWTELKCS